MVGLQIQTLYLFSVFKKMNIRCLYPFRQLHIHGYWTILNTTWKLAFLLNKAGDVSNKINETKEKACTICIFFFCIFFFFFIYFTYRGHIWFMSSPGSGWICNNDYGSLALYNIAIQCNGAVIETYVYRCIKKSAIKKV